MHGTLRRDSLGSGVEEKKKTALHGTFTTLRSQTRPKLRPHFRPKTALPTTALRAVTTNQSSTANGLKVACLPAKAGASNAVPRRAS